MGRFGPHLSLRHVALVVIGEVNVMSQGDGRWVGGGRGVAWRGAGVGWGGRGLPGEVGLEYSGVG